jgi:hypothetical protein
MKAKVSKTGLQVSPRAAVNSKAVATLAGLALIVLGAGFVVVHNLLPKAPELPKGLENLPKLPEAPALSDNPVELAFGTDKLDWNMADFNVEGTANNPSVYQNVTKEEARQFNLKLPFEPSVGPSAAPFYLVGKTQLDAARAQHCLSLAVYYEAASEPMQGQYSVAQVVLNRVRHPAWPHSVCGVVFQGAERATGCQFSFTCNGALAKKPVGRPWLIAQGVAGAALSGFVTKDVGLATHYHTDWVAPVWAPTLRKLKQIGAHIFYTWKGGGGGVAAFKIGYEGKEAWPTLAALTAPQLGPPDSVQAVISAAGSNGEALTGVDADLGLPTPQGNNASAGGQISGSGDLSGGHGSDLAHAKGAGGKSDGSAANLALSARLESDAARLAFGGTEPARAPVALPKPGPDGLMPEPDLAAVLPKYQIPTEPPKRPSFVPPKPAEPKRAEQRARALDGL